MTYKISRFNYCFSFEESEGEVYIFNTLTRKLIKINDSYCVKNFVDALSSLDEDSIKTLLDKGIIVPETCDEIEKIKTITTKMKYSSECLMLTIIPTNACNFKCIYCYQPSAHGYMDEIAEKSIIKWLRKNLKYYKKLNLNWFGGEPFLCKDVMIRMMADIKGMCKEYGVAMVSSVTTNGYLLDVDTFKHLVKNGLIFYQVTIDGNKETHNFQRPHKIDLDSYSRILTNLKNITALPSRFRFEIGIRINLSGNMREEDIYEFIDEMGENFSHDKRFTLIWQWVRDWGGERIKQYDVFRLMRQADDCLKYVEYAKSKGLYVADLVSTTTGTDACEAFYKNGYVVNYDARVYKCAMRLDDEKNNCIGYIDPNGNLRVSLEKELQWLQNDHITAKCKDCIFLPVCLSNRCHYSHKVAKKLECIECKEMIYSQIESMISKGKYSTIFLIGGH